MKSSLDINMLQCPQTGNALSFGNECLEGGAESFYFRNGYYSFVNSKQELAKQDQYIKRIYDMFSKIYDTAMPMLFPFLGLSEKGVRRDIIRYLNLQEGDKVLEVSIGTGSNIPLLLETHSKIKVFGIDISSGMLEKCVKNLRRWKLLDVPIFQTTASQLPFKDNQFDAVLHVGGINSFAEKEKALAEMLRVVKPGGRIVINDEGLSPQRQKEWYSRIFIKSMFALFASLEKGEMDPPEYILPKDGYTNYKLDYIGNGCFWVMSFNKPME